MKLAVGFICYNERSVKYLPEFLPSLFAALKFLSPAEYQVLVFDNSSSGYAGNRLILNSYNIEYSALGENLGFARAYNIMINRALELRADYFLMINPDMILEPDSISKLIAGLDADRQLASAAPKIRRWDFAKHLKTDIIDSAGLILEPGLKFIDLGQGQKDEGQFDGAAILGPSGAAGIFRLSSLVKIKEDRPSGKTQYFDENFFMYREDCDLAYRLNRAGLFSRPIPDAIIYHDRNAASSGRGLFRQIIDRRKKSRQIRAWSFRNQHYIFVKHWSDQNMINKAIIILKIAAMFVFSLILEQFLLKEYPLIFKYQKVLTNIK